jgi:hypothetical protein
VIIWGSFFSKKMELLCYNRRWRHESRIWYTEYGLTILSHIVLAKFAITSRDIFGFPHNRVT